MKPDNEVLLKSFMGRKLHTNTGSSELLTEQELRGLMGHTDYQGPNNPAVLTLHW